MEMRGAVAQISQELGPYGLKSCPVEAQLLLLFLFPHSLSLYFFYI